MTTAETISGVVEARNERGIRVAGEWRNLSKFRPLELPSVGAHVSLGLDPKGFINTLEVLGDESQRVHVYPLVPAREGSQTNERITRLAVLKAAAAFGASRPDCKSADVLKIADAWLAWVRES